MKGFETLHVKPAVKSRSSMDLSFTHLTTMDFGQIVPLAAIETVPSDKFNIQASYFSRTAPLVKPTYGKFSFRTASIFVPYYQIADDFEAFVAGRTTWLSSTPTLRYITPEDVLKVFINYNQNNTATGASATNYDITYTDPNGNQAYRLLLPRGRFFQKVLNSLGYVIPENADLQSGSAWLAGFGAKKLSAMPLLAFLKAYNDYMSQSQRYNSSTLTNYLNKIRQGVNVSNVYSNGHVIVNGLVTMLAQVILSYENDYFTSAWEEATSPLEDQEGISRVLTPVQVDGENVLVAVHNDNDTYLTDTSETGYLGQRALDFLKSFDDWVRRNNYSGSREVQQIYSRFGIKPEDYNSNYAHVLKTSVKPIQVGDVTATASSTDESLGDYAGKAILNGDDSISFDCTDYGMLFILGYYTVSPMYAYGYDRTVLRSEPLDWYTPEFDGLGAQAISYAEVFENPKALAAEDQSSSDNVFGYTERYNEYRYGRDKITGDFRNFGTSEMNTWHTGRMLTTLRNAGTMVAQSSSMNTLPQTDSEYNRIFSITDSSVDHFYMTAQFKVSAIRPMLSLNQATRLGEGDTVVPRNGNTIN